MAYVIYFLWKNLSEHNIYLELDHMLAELNYCLRAHSVESNGVPQGFVELDRRCRVEDDRHATCQDLSVGRTQTQAGFHHVTYHSDHFAQ